ncbi:MAG: hypothetical protein E7384_06705 [Ruminococcaceae bacterium]|nr:hypothetical protein [Oscillospiraceae bacterium]
MKKIQKSSELLWLLGIVFVAFGVAICSKADLGVSMIAAPSFVLSEILLKWSSIFSVGVTEYVFEGLLLLLMCVVVRRFNWRYLLSFAVAVLYGYILNFFLWLLCGVKFDAVWLRWVMLIVGDMIIAFGVACFFRTYMPLQVYELFVSEIADRFKLKITKVKWSFDISLLVFSLALAIFLFGDIGSFDWTSIGYLSFHNIGLGTLVTTVINSPAISLTGKLVDKIFAPTPCFPRIENVLKIK